MGVVKNLIVRAGFDGSELEKGLKNASKSMKNAGRELTAIGKTMTIGITAPIAAAAGAAFKMAANMEDAMGATNQIFGNSAASMQSWAKDLKSYYGIASGEALEYGNMMGSMLQNIGGLTEDEAAKQSQALITLAGDLTAMFGGTTQDAVNALTGALKGNNSMLDNYGMGVNEATIKAKALEMGLISQGGTMDLASKQAATLALIMEQTGSAQGQAAREAEGASGSMRAMTTELKNLATSFGTILLPILTPIITKIKEMVEKFGALDEETKKNIVTGLLLAAAIGPVIMVIGSLTSGIGGALLAFSKFSKAIKAGQTVLSALGVMMGPAGLVMIGILAFAAAAFLVIKNWDSIKAFFSGLGETIKGIFEKMKKSVLSVWNGLVSGMLNIGTNIVKGLWDGINGAASWLKEKIKGFAGGIVQGIKDTLGIASPSKVMADSVGKWIPAGIAQGITDNQQVVHTALSGLVDGITTGLEILKAQFALWTSTIGLTATETEKLSVQLASENAQLQLLNAKVAEAQKAYTEMAKIKGVNATETQKLYLNLLNEIQAQADLKKQIDKTNASLTAQAQIKSSTTTDSKGNTVRSSYDPTTGTSWSTKNGVTTVIDKNGNRTVESGPTKSEIAEMAKQYPKATLNGLKSLVNISKRIPALAKGGIVDRPTLALIGEAGPEKVTPLDKDNSGMNVTINVRSPYDVAKELSIIDKKLAWGL